MQSIALFILHVILKNQKDLVIHSSSTKFLSSSSLCPMPRGRPPKRQRNTSGLKNQGSNKRTRHQESPLADGEIDLDSDQDRSRGVQDPLPIPSSSGSSSPKKSLNIDGQTYFFRASFGVECGQEGEQLAFIDLDDSESESDEESDGEDASMAEAEDNSWEEDVEFQEKLYNWAKENGDDPKDEDWVPPSLRRRQKKKGGCCFFLF